MRTAAGIIARISDLGGRLAAAALVLIMLLVFGEVVLRNLFGRSTMVADEMSGYLNVAVVFLGLAYALKERSFIRVEIVYQTLRGHWQTFARWFILLASMAYALVVLVYMWRYVRYSWSAGIVSTDVSQTPLYLPQALIVIGAALLAAQLLAYVLTRARDLP